jgi:hypothetical protein
MGKYNTCVCPPPKTGSKLSNPKLLIATFKVPVGADAFGAAVGDAPGLAVAAPVGLATALGGVVAVALAGAVGVAAGVVVHPARVTMISKRIETDL